ncbi:sensor histidine kinase [Swaminathania salitolerans]|uniref:histidine kinase n=1 Tax=Swaminathania salitolerans TaxID=182838 RepID=A0A511BSA7_9PROT|nr:ATP-binding protein [Swaminathania salitolerans]GBQ14326.1 two component sensor histidine kinase PhoR [Swaminathania salitolerans LMG 21291]GEL02992.1 two-component sensor histidine kinase [Swaminathania salitolerans]
MLLDDGGRILHANRTARSTFGDTLGAVIRHPAVQSVLSSLTPETAVVTRVELDVPVRRIVQVTFRKWPDRFARSVDWEEGVLAVLEDCSETEVVDRMRADFVAYASHELRTPLASLMGFIETLQGPASDDPAAQQQFLAIMAAQAARMERLIERLLYLSRVQRLEHLRPHAVVAAQDLMDRLLEDSHILMRDSDARLVILPVEEELFFPADEDQIVQVLLNLVENALKYGGPGIEIRVGIVAEGARGVEIVVSDNGRGVDTQHVPRLTERFYRVEGRANAAQSGTGLGLAIVKHIVDRHGGRFRIESAPGKGMSCRIWLPRES